MGTWGILDLTAGTIMADEEQQVVEQEVEEAEVAEEEADLVDPMVETKEKCSQTKACAALFEKLTSCNTRVASKTETTETCVEEESDFLHCVDHCLAPQLFKHLK